MMKKRTPVSLLKAILLTALLAGSIDIASAIIHYLLNGNHDPARVLVYIASGVFGEAAFAPDAGMRMAAAGLAFHYTIALGWTILFFSAYTGLKALSGNRFVLGIVYGVFVWLVMNLVVVPLSNTPAIPLDFLNAAIGMGIIIIAIGLPVSLMAYRYFHR